MKRVLRSLAAPAAVIGVLSAPGSAVAGLIQVGEAVEDKGSVTTVIGHNEFRSHMLVILHAPDWGDRAGTYFKRNREVFVIDRVITEHFYNVYPVFIDIPQPVDLLANITIPFFMATGPSKTDLRPLPADSSVASAELESGKVWHPAKMTSFFDVFTELPLTGPNGEQYQWDLSGFTQSQGNFYLAEVTMTAGQFSYVPEPSSAWLAVVGLAGLLGLRPRRHAMRNSR